MRSNWFWFVIAFLCFILGFILGKVVNVPGITLQREINPIHLVSIVTTLLVAVVIGLLIDAQRKKSVFQKELIVQRIDAASDVLVQIQEKVSEGMKITFAGKLLFMAALSCAILIPIALTPELNAFIEAAKIFMFTMLIIALVACGTAWLLDDAV